MNSLELQRQRLYPSALSGDRVRLLERTEVTESSNNKLSFHLIDVALETAPPYFALSYRWQDPDPGRPDISITCNGVELPVGLNLFNALTQITQLDNRLTTFWVDFVCIEQDNEVEKQIQLLLMPRIYQRALQVFIWLGPASDESDSAIVLLVGAPSVMKRVDESQQPESGASLSDDDLKTYNSLMDLVRLQEGGFTDYFEPLWNLLNRDWFGRVWTVQEAAAQGTNCRILCGTKHCSYSNLLHLTSRFLGATSSDSHWVKVVDSIRSNKVAQDPERPLRPILAHSKAVLRMRRVLSTPSRDRGADLTAVRFLNDLRTLNCIDPRDRIFAATPFLRDDLIKSIRERSSWQVEELYTLFAATELDIGKNMDCLATAGLCYHRRSYPDKYPASPTTPHLAIPSWVPDWTYPKTYEPLSSLINGRLERDGKRLYQASGHTRPDIRITKFNTRPIAIIRGVIVDAVLDVGDGYRMTTWQVGYGADEQVEQLRQHMSLMMTQVDDCVSLAFKHLPPKSGAETTRTIHNVRKALVGDLLPVAFNGPEALPDRAIREEIDATFERARNDLQYWVRVSEEKRRNASPRVLTREEQEAQQREDAEWKRVYRSKPVLSTCLATTFKGRRFLVTENRRFGLVPSIAIPGDKICVFFGGDTPFVIRPVDPPEVSQAHSTSGAVGGQGEEMADIIYMLIGECYINDLMDGEAIKMDDVHAQDIHLG